MISVNPLSYFSYDARQSSVAVSSPSHWSDSSIAGRVSFVLQSADTLGSVRIPRPGSL